jgi:hypothetical protein
LYSLSYAQAANIDENEIISSFITYIDGIILAENGLLINFFLRPLFYGLTFMFLCFSF